MKRMEVMCPYWARSYCNHKRNSSHFKNHKTKCKFKPSKCPYLRDSPSIAVSPKILKESALEWLKRAKNVVTE